MNTQNSGTDSFSNFLGSSQKVIAVVDDEPDILELVSIHLKKAGFNVKTFETAESFFKFLKSGALDLVILDIMLPDSDGFEICKHLKADPNFQNVPIIMLSAKNNEMEKVFGLEIGADDYVTKPFSPRELVARVKVVMRRDDSSVKSSKVKIGELLEIDNQKYEIYVSGTRVDLTSSEFKILKLLAEKKGWVYDREQILEYLGGNEKGVLDRTVDVHIKNLREKLGAAGKFIKNIRGVGYKLEV